MSDFTPAQTAFVQAEIRRALETSLPFRFIGNQVVTDKDWYFRSKLMSELNPVRTDILKTLVFS